MCVSGNLWIVVKDVKPLLVYDVECEMAMDSMKGKCVSSWVDLGYTNLYGIPEVTSEFFSCRNSVLGDSLQVHLGNRGSLRLWLGTRNSSVRISSITEEKPAFFWVRVSRGPLYLRQKTQSCSHIPISEGRLLLSCFWKAGLPLQLKTGNHSHPQTKWGAQKFPQADLMKLMILYNWDGFLRESLEFPKGSQDTCSVWWRLRYGYGANARDFGLISIWFGEHLSILRSWGDIRVRLLLWQVSCGFSSVPSGKSRFLTSLIGNMELFSTKCRGIGPHLAGRGKSHGISRVAAGTWGIFSSYSGDVHSKL